MANESCYDHYFCTHGDLINWYFLVFVFILLCISNLIKTSVFLSIQIVRHIFSNLSRYAKSSNEYPQGFRKEFFTSTGKPPRTNYHTCLSTRSSLPHVFTVPWTHNFSKNCIYFCWHQFRLLWFSKLNWYRFNHHKRQNEMNLRNELCILRTPENTIPRIKKTFITIYFHIWAQY